MKEYYDILVEMLEETKMAFSDFAILCSGIAILTWIVASAILQLY